MVDFVPYDSAVKTAADIAAIGAKVSAACRKAGIAVPLHARTGADQLGRVMAAVNVPTLAHTDIKKKTRALRPIMMPVDHICRV